MNFFKPTLSIFKRDYLTQSLDTIDNNLKIVVQRFIKELFNNKFNLEKSKLQNYKDIISFLKEFEAESGIKLNFDINTTYLSKIKNRGLPKYAKQKIYINDNAYKFIIFSKNLFPNFDDKAFISRFFLEESSQPHIIDQHNSPSTQAHQITQHNDSNTQTLRTKTPKYNFNFLQSWLNLLNSSLDLLNSSINPLL